MNNFDSDAQRKSFYGTHGANFDKPPNTDPQQREIPQKREPPKEFYNVRLDRATDKVKSQTESYGLRLAQSSLSVDGLRLTLPVIDNLTYSGQLSFDNENWEFIYKEGGEKGLHSALKEIKERELNSALFNIEKEFGYAEHEKRPKNEGEKIGKQLWYATIEQDKDEALGKMKNREQDFARSKQVIKDVIDYQFNLMFKELPRP